MFDKMGSMMEQLKLMQRLMKDENFRAFIGHPKPDAAFLWIAVPERHEAAY